MVALVVARRVLGRSTPKVARLAVAFSMAFAAYEMLLFAFALVAGGTGTFTPSIVLRIFANDAAWLIGLMMLNALLTRAAPRIFGQPPAFRFG